MTKVLFLDDMPERHKAFVGKVGMRDDVEVYRVWSAAGAIKCLQTHQFDQVFLDHDLSIEDIMADLDASTQEPTGMVVVDFICSMLNPPPRVIIHTCNEPAAFEMEHRLKAIRPSIAVVRLPFPALIKAMS